MAQEYKITSVKKRDTWDSDYGTFQSYAIALEGIGEPVSLNKKVPVKHEPVEGEMIYGSLEEKEKNGKVWFKFKAEKKPDFGKPKLDPLTMYVSYAKDVFVAMYQQGGSVDSNEFKANMQLIAEQGKQLMENVQ